MPFTRSPNLRLRSLVVFASLWLLSCTTTLTPPRPLGTPVSVALIDHGRHASLVIEAPLGKVTRYAYGEWNYFALSNNALTDGLRALLWPTPAALGRRELTPPLTHEHLTSQLVEGWEQILIFSVNLDQAQYLKITLDEIYRQNRSSHRYNPLYDLHFVKHPDSYWMLHNSNQVMAEWLTLLGCEVKGTALVSKWKVQRHSSPPSSEAER